MADTVGAESPPQERQVAKSRRLWPRPGSVPSFGDVALRSLSKNYDGSGNAVLIPELRVQRGEFLTLVGPSGCGKSTTLRMIAGLEYPTSGEVWFGETNVTDLPPQKRNVSMVFQSYALYPHMKARANLEYGMKKRGVPKAERDRRIAEAAELLGISRLLERRPRQLSGGEQQRVALGRAIVRDPDLLLLDEPLSNLDAQMRATLRTEIVRIQKLLGCTTLYVTHDQLEALTMSDRMAVMRAGTIEQLATPDEVYTKPANVFVAGFIGSPAMNFLAGRMEPHPDGSVFRTGPGDTAPLAGIAATEGDRTLGVRPHDVEIGPEDGPGLPMTVMLVQLVGSDKQLTLEGPSGSLVARVDAETSLAAGAHVTCGFRRGRVHLFDEAGKRLAGV